MLNRTVCQQVLDILGDDFWWEYKGNNVSILYKKSGFFFGKPVGKLEYLEVFRLWILDEEVAIKLESLPIIVFLTPFFYE